MIRVRCLARSPSSAGLSGARAGGSAPCSPAGARGSSQTGGGRGGCSAACAAAQSSAGSTRSAVRLLNTRQRRQRQRTLQGKAVRLKDCHCLTDLPPASLSPPLGATVNAPVLSSSVPVEPLPPLPARAGLALWRGFGASSTIMCRRPCRIHAAVPKSSQPYPMYATCP
eukprot:SAG22_NODE_1432_length_4436_cov_4.264007_5_plen_169_part_00